MYCPRCGAPNPDTTKFCRQCGLPVAQLTGYVASGGAELPTAPQSARHPLDKMTEGMTPRQKMLLSILFFVFLVPVLKILGLDPLAKIASVLMPAGIIWSVFHFKAQERRLRQRMAQQQMMPVQPLPVPTQQPVLPTQTYQPPIYQPPAPPPTNPLAQVHNSVTEDETRRLPA